MRVKTTPGRFFFSSMLEEILDIRNVQKAFKQVTANKGAGGIDGMQTDELRDYLNANWQTLRANILEGSYKPQAVRKVEILKPQGGTRMLGIPTVTDPACAHRRQLKKHKKCLTINVDKGFRG